MSAPLYDARIEVILSTAGMLYNAVFEFHLFLLDIQSFERVSSLNYGNDYKFFQQ